MLQRVKLRFSVGNFLCHMAEKVFVKVEVSRFCVEIFLPHSVSVFLFSGLEKVYASGGYVKNFRRISLSRRKFSKNFAGEPFCGVIFRKFTVAKNFMDEE